jgi:EmrB/QacA subfamily drug resistance transporter
MAFIDNSVVNVALPALQTDLNTTLANAQWVVEAYTLFLASLMLAGGSLGDRYGRRRLYAIGISLFAGASVWAGLAPNIAQLITARALQGTGGALLVPGSLAIIGAFFSNEERGQAIGTWSGFSAMTTVLGPVLGGWLVENISWRWVFFINVPLAIITLLILFWRVPESRDEAAGSLDLPGAFLATVGLSGLVFGLIESSNLSFSHPLVVGSLAGGAMALIAFLFVEANSSAPMIPFRLFRSRTFSSANLLTLFLYSALNGVLFFFPFNLIQVQGYSATAAGAAFLPFIVILFLLSRWAGGLVGRFGAKRPLIIGPTLTAVGLVLFTLPGIGGSYWTTFFPAMVVLGLGMAVTVAPLTTAVMNAVPNRHSGTASGINNAVSRTAGLLAIAIFGVFMHNTFNLNLNSHLSSLAIAEETQQQLSQERSKLAAAEIPGGISQEKQQALQQAIDQSFIAGFRLVMFIAAGLALVSAALAAVLIDDEEVKNSEVSPGSSA